MHIEYESLLANVQAFQPARYLATRNYTNGHLSKWSPYISRGFLSPALVMNHLKASFVKKDWIGFLQQMAWREYFQRVWQQKGPLLLTDLKHKQSNVVVSNLPLPLLNGETGIHAIDHAIHQLVASGYLHNHLRMYIAMLHSNVFKAAWLPGAKWMYAHLLDHDPASNFLSWQWVAGTFSSKPYLANQENINKFTNSIQVGSFLDTAYENLTATIFNSAGEFTKKYNHTWKIPIDTHFEIDTHSILEKISREEKINKFRLSSFDSNVPTCIYNSFNLDPLWHAGEKINRILLLEPSHFTQYPITEKVFQFIIQLALTNIPGIQLFIGNFDELVQAMHKENSALVVAESVPTTKNIYYYKEHPTTLHYHGIQEQRDWLFPEVSGYYPSFFGYWKKCERFI